MCRQILLLVLICFEISLASTPTPCDMNDNIEVEEGNMGETSLFSWLGVLRVYLYDHDSKQIAMTGIVLVKPKHAIAVADDIVKIPKNAFEHDTEAVFISGEEDEPLVFKPKSYVIHPEYEATTTVSIVLIELDIDNPDDYPITPICFPETPFTQGNIYLVGITDENELLEKVIYRMRYFNKKNCDKFYRKEGLVQRDNRPNSYLCGYWPSENDCVWDSGMALVSNHSGIFTLLGFSVHGPGCAAPARFINMSAYASWIRRLTSTELEEDISADTDRDFDGKEFVPVHETFRQNEFRRFRVTPEHAIIPYFHVPYPFSPDYTSQFEHFHIAAINEDSIMIYPFNTTMELYNQSCIQYRTLLYREYFELKGFEGITGTATYKLSLFDLTTEFCSCVKLTVQCTNRSLATFSINEVLDFSEGIQMDVGNNTIGQTPDDVIKIYPITERTDGIPELKKKNSKKDTKPKFLHESFEVEANVVNYDLYIKFEFNTRSVLEFEIYGIPIMFGTTEIYDTDPFTNKTVRRYGVGPDTTTVKPSRSRKKKKKIKKFWDAAKKAEVKIVAEHDIVRETVSVGCSDEPLMIVTAFIVMISFKIAF